ncbi:aldo/keto reductase [Ureibacillus sinduriensis]|uniref:Aldo/keto reductase n=1 Tax=Ureibacillus sinduriensis BLB-1 = JCM 15800 TaxID=1384057 RepID=A0A0A3IJP8_9BACL|nr:aldo/keto reductase [Ureibacillus sinduriensis]KGR75097.1 aldo/keto reductase [Ureibacillus sinduriensis BLB-1 = JCM 15800]
MEFNTVGKTGIHVSNLCFGTMSFGGIADEETSIAMYKQCREAGLNFFDTANVYNGGQSEEILGKCISGHRNEVVLTSKAGLPTEKDLNSGGLSKRNLTLAIEQSLKRLGTDRIEFYFVHLFDEYTDIEEVVRTLDDLQKQGKILYPAVSNWAAWQIAKALGISDRELLARFELIQPMYNLVKRQAEVEIFPLAHSEQLGVVTYSPLGGGLLSGKYGSKQKKAEQGRLKEQKNYEQRYGVTSYYEIADQFTELASQWGYHPASLAVSWVLNHPDITAPIIGARNPEQLALSIDGTEISLSRAQRDQITALTIEPPLATDHSSKEELFKKYKK